MQQARAVLMIGIGRSRRGSAGEKQERSALRRGDVPRETPTRIMVDDRLGQSPKPKGCE